MLIVSGWGEQQNKGGYGLICVDDLDRGECFGDLAVGDLRPVEVLEWCRLECLAAEAVWGEGEEQGGAQGEGWGGPRWSW